MDSPKSERFEVDLKPHQGEYLKDLDTASVLRNRFKTRNKRKVKNYDIKVC